ncbi:MAG: nucleotidyltransferase domain-containing protein [Desulfovibrionales bacterium]|nr:MAG: nucleotidyltransferase domain-containing protein [Desulfovibrionales bacterium]
MNPYLSQLHSILQNHLQDHPARVYLFGSMATGTFRAGSDCDVGIEPLRDFPPGLLASLRERLEESTIPFPIDVVDLSSASAAFHEQVKKDGKLWITTHGA